MKLQDFIIKHQVEVCSNRIDEDVIASFEDAMNVSFGTELREYVVTYGYLAFGSIELYGINSIQGVGSDMVKQTVYLHQYFPKTANLVALENQGDGDYFMVGSDDEVFEFDSEMNELRATGLSLFQYILKRFESVIS